MPPDRKERAHASNHKTYEDRKQGQICDEAGFGLDGQKRNQRVQRWAEARIADHERDRRDAGAYHADKRTFNHKWATDEPIRSADQFHDLDFVAPRIDGKTNRIENDEKGYGTECDDDYCAAYARQPGNPQQFADYVGSHQDLLDDRRVQAKFFGDFKRAGWVQHPDLDAGGKWIRFDDIKNLGQVG